MVSIGDDRTHISVLQLLHLQMGAKTLVHYCNGAVLWLSLGSIIHQTNWLMSFSSFLNGMLLLTIHTPYTT